MKEFVLLALQPDKYGRPIQTIADNNLGGQDILSNNYDFAGNLLSTKHVHTTLYQTYVYEKTYQYDHMGRLKSVNYQTDGATGENVTLYELTYNKLGQVEEKKLHKEANADFLQAIEYQYNMQGALTNINDPHNMNPGDLFAMQLSYATNGNIEQIDWNSQNQAEVNTYQYQYDLSNRLTKATHSPGNRYDVSIDYLCQETRHVFIYLSMQSVCCFQDGGL